MIGNLKSVFNPNSVMQAIDNRWCTSYWGRTASFEIVEHYIKMNYQGLKDDILFMLSGGSCPVDPAGFQNDLSVIASKDDVFTALIHLGYLSYDREEGACYIPNMEVSLEFYNAIRHCDWGNVFKSLEASRKLVDATLRMDEEAVARAIDLAHDENTSILSYNDENSLACVLSLAFYFAMERFIVHRELASGKGFADLVLIPRDPVQYPAIVLELKYNKDAESAIAQIKQKNYIGKVSDYAGDVLLVGINYDNQTKEHTCRIEKMPCPAV